MIDRERLVRGHTVVLTSWHPSDTLTLGNGDFGLGVDLTGLQTFPDEHELRPRPRFEESDDGVTRPPKLRFDRDDFPIPLRIQSTWGWYETEGSHDLDEAATSYPTRRGLVRYPDRMRLGPDGRLPDGPGGWLYANPRRLDLGRIGLRFPNAEVSMADLADLRIELDLWAGIVHSRFLVLGHPVEVHTVVHPGLDAVATRVVSPLLGTGELEVAVSFPPQRDPLTPSETLTDDREMRSYGCVRRVGLSTYHVAVRTSRGDDALERTVWFGSGEPPRLPSFAETAQAAATHWAGFWRSGAAVSLAGSTDARAAELERRIVLSQYLTAVHCSGSMPPQETGLVHNSWGGKSHLEMHWWHAAHFVLWGRPELLEGSLGWYDRIRDAARQTARRQGYRGVRWPKQVGPDGRESPSMVGVFLVWQQPHPIYYAELLRLAGHDPKVLETHAETVFATADFMADFAEADDEGVYHLGPPVVPAQENYYPVRGSTADPTFELAYWHWGLRTAQQWRIRLGLDPEPTWDTVAEGLARPLVQDGKYAAIGTEPYLLREDHPSTLMALGFLPRTPLIDPALISATYDDVLRDWDMESTWGWDYPVLAMCATRLGRPHDAVNALLTDTYKNHHLRNGHVPQYPGGLSVYLPANGGLLAAVALMARGWHGCDRPLPGFPTDGTWQVEYEGLSPSPADL